MRLFLLMEDKQKSCAIWGVIYCELPNQVQTNNGSFIQVMPGARILIMVAMILIDPSMDEMPSICTEKIRKSENQKIRKSENQKISTWRRIGS